MIIQVSSTDPRFKTVTLEPGFNIILADRSRESSDKDSRNGLGKSSLLNVIHFLLGSNPAKDVGLRRAELSAWTYQMILTLSGKPYIVERQPANFSKVYLCGDFTDWAIQPELDLNSQKYFLRNPDWCSILGSLMFDLPVETKEKYFPGFRGLISFFAREGADAYNEPFRHMAKQLEWDKQVQNAYLLNLNFEFPIALQHLKDKEETLNQLKKAAEQGLLGDFTGSVGELEAERVRLSEQVNNLDFQLKDFNVHPEYRSIQEEANALTEKIQTELNDRNIGLQLLRNYKENLEQEKDVSVKSVQTIYNEVGISFPDKLVKTLEEIQSFHSQVIKNRKEYLTSEILKWKRQIQLVDLKIAGLSDERKKSMEILQTHGALDEHFKLQQRSLEKKQLLSAITKKISNLKLFQEGKSDLKIDREDILKKMRRDYDERKELIDQAIIAFNKNSQVLYDEPGTLSIDVANTGYKFNVDIKRSGSHGINVMKVLTYDLSLAQLRCKQQDKPGFLIHDSSIFDGVDERQIARGLERAYALSKECNFQYICTLNSDIVPYREFSEGFDKTFDDSIKVRLDDATPSGGLFGFRF